MKNALLSLLAVSLITACSSSDSITSNNRQSLSIPFSAVAGDTAITCDATLSPVGALNSSATVLDFKFYVHDIVLSGDDGKDYALTITDSDWQDRGVALLDFTDKSNAADGCDGAIKDTNQEITGTVNASRDVAFEGISFRIGVPEALNHIGRDQFDAGSILNLSSMDWGWQNGHKHMKLDVDPVQGSLTRWNFHLGTTGCTGGSSSAPEQVTCSHKNIPSITLNSYRQGIDTIELDYAALVEGTDITSNAAGTPTGCMSNPPAGDTADCSDLFAQLGLDYSTGARHTSTVQSVFSVQ